MNWDQIEGNWKEFKGAAKEQWGKLTDDDLTRAAGRRDQLAGCLQQRYGLAKEDAERQIDEFASLHGDTSTRDQSSTRGIDDFNDTTRRRF